MSEECNINTSDNLVIYGHHMNHKKVFGALENYKAITTNLPFLLLYSQVESVINLL